MGPFWPLQEEYFMEFTPIRPIEPLFDSLTQPAKQAEENPAVSMFANVLDGRAHV